MNMKSILIKDTTKEEREELYQDYIDGKREIREINMEYNERYLHGRQIKG